jgi:hypothetical protein
VSQCRSGLFKGKKNSLPSLRLEIRPVQPAASRYTHDGLAVPRFHVHTQVIYHITLRYITLQNGCAQKEAPV